MSTEFYPVDPLSRGMIDRLYVLNRWVGDEDEDVDTEISLLDRSMYNNSTGTYAPFENDEDGYLTNSKSQV